MGTAAGAAKGVAGYGVGAVQGVAGYGVGAVKWTASKVILCIAKKTVLTILLDSTRV